MRCCPLCRKCRIFWSWFLSDVHFWGEESGPLLLMTSFSDLSPSSEQSLLFETLTQLISSYPIQKMIRIFKNKPLRPLNESPSSYNFLQRCSKQKGRFPKKPLQHCKKTALLLLLFSGSPVKVIPLFQILSHSFPSSSSSRNLGLCRFFQYTELFQWGFVPELFVSNSTFP